MVTGDLIDSLGEIAEAVAVRRQDFIGIETGHLLQRIEEVTERVAGAIASGDRDVRADRRQHVIARPQQAVLGRVEAQLARRVAWSPDGVDVPSRHVDPRAVVDDAIGDGEPAEPACSAADGRQRRGRQLGLVGPGVPEHRDQLVGEVRKCLRRPTRTIVVVGHRP